MKHFVRFLFCMLLTLPVFAVGTVQQTISQLGKSDSLQVVAFRWTGDASTGSVPVTAAALAGCCQGYLITQVETVPGSPAPTAGYSVAITDAAGVDALDGAAASLSATTPESFAAASSSPPLQGAFNLVITGQSVASAKGVVYVFLVKPGTFNAVNLTRGIGSGASNSANWLTLANAPFVDARRYNFSAQTPGGTLSAGACSFQMSPLPTGVIVGGNLYLSGGTGAAEVLDITGISGTTVSGTCANGHSGAWTVASVNAGGTEAMGSMTAGVGGIVWYPAGTYTFHGPFKRRLGMAVYILGAGQRSTKFSIASDFPLSATAVLDWTPGDGAAITEGGGGGFAIEFTQPDSASIGDYTHWPPAIDVTGTYHTTWSDISLVRCWDGVAILGNTNGANFRNIIGSNFHLLFNLYGRSFDTVRIEGAHSSTLGLTSLNQINVFLGASTGNKGFDVGTIDDLKIDGATIGTALCGAFGSGASGLGAAAEISNLWCEGNITVSNGKFEFSNVTMAGGGSIPLFGHTGGIVQIVNSTFLYVGSNTAMYSNVTGSSSSAAGTYASEFSMSNSRLDTQGENVPMLTGAAAAPYTDLVYYTLTGNHFHRSGGIAYSTPAISINNGTGTVMLTATGNRFSPAGGGTGVALYIGNDEHHVVTGNDGGGFSYTLPATVANIRWNGNANFLANVDFPARAAFAGLGTPANGALVYCTDCTVASPCAGGGTGAMAKRLAGAWECQ